jgi:hypothetical protein
MEMLFRDIKSVKIKYTGANNKTDKYCESKKCKFSNCRNAKIIYDRNNEIVNCEITIPLFGDYFRPIYLNLSICEKREDFRCKLKNTNVVWGFEL